MHVITHMSEALASFAVPNSLLYARRQARRGIYSSSLFDLLLTQVYAVAVQPVVCILVFVNCIRLWSKHLTWLSGIHFSAPVILFAEVTQASRPLVFQMLVSASFAVK